MFDKVLNIALGFINDSPTHFVFSFTFFPCQPNVLCFAFSKITSYMKLKLSRVNLLFTLNVT